MAFKLLISAVHHLLAQDCSLQLEEIRVIAYDNISVDHWLYRAETDQIRDAVISQNGFRFPKNNHPNVVGLGGLFFACGFRHVLRYARNRQSQAHFFMCERPIFQQVYDDWTLYPRTFLMENALVRNVRLGSELGDEFIVAGRGDST